MGTNKIERSLIKQSAKILAGISLSIGKVAANSACIFIYHQPKMPQALKKMRKN